MILGGRAPEIFILQLFGNSLSQSSIKSSAYRANLCAELPVGCWSYSHFLSIFGDRLELYVIVIGLIHRPGLTWDLLLLSTDEDKHQWWCVVHLIYCSWFNLIKCAVWLSGFQVKGIIHRGAVCYESQHHVICNRLWLRIAENAFSLTPSSNNFSRQRPGNGVNRVNIKINVAHRALRHCRWNKSRTVTAEFS